MSGLAVGVVFAITATIWIRYAYVDYHALRNASPEVRQELERLSAAPDENEERLWTLIRSFYTIRDVMPGTSNRDWILVGILISGFIPLIVAVGFGLAKPLARQFLSVSAAAHRVSDREFGAKADLVKDAPAEVRGLADDFNAMSAQLEQYEREMRESSAMLAHELRTPLNAAMGRVRGMLDSVFPRDDQQLQMVHRQLEQINRLVGDLHLLSLARAGQLSLHTEEVSLTDVAQEALRWLEGALDEAGLVPDCRLDPTVVVSADRGRVGQVATILVQNVLRHAKQGGSLRLHVRREPPWGVLEVADSGPGVPIESLPKLVDRFWRADQSRTRDSGGTGLGLAIAAAICQAHGGTLSFERVLPTGLSSTVRLPLRRP
nr:ATP-binding protein [Pseudoxanthomonas sp. Root630]